MTTNENKMGEQITDYGVISVPLLGESVTPSSEAISVVLGFCCFSSISDI